MLQEKKMYVTGRTTPRNIVSRTTPGYKTPGDWFSIPFNLISPPYSKYFYNATFIFPIKNQQDNFKINHEL